MKTLFYIAISAMLLSACGKKVATTDANGALLAENLTTSDSSGLNFAPMKHEDSAFVKNFKPTVYLFDGKPYTGNIAYYNEKKALIVSGSLKEGLADGEWKFFFPSGVIQMEGTYNNGMETGMWSSYYRKNFPKIVKYYNNEGYMLMRKEYFDDGKVKNYQNIKCPEFGNLERRIQFTNKGEIDYIDAERELGKLDPAILNQMLQDDGLLKK